LGGGAKNYPPPPTHLNHLPRAPSQRHNTFWMVTMIILICPEVDRRCLGCPVYIVTLLSMTFCLSVSTLPSLIFLTQQCLNLIIITSVAHTPPLRPPLVCTSIMLSWPRNTKKWVFPSQCNSRVQSLGVWSLGHDITTNTRAQSTSTPTCMSVTM
jgi:hypothetical protein